MAKKRSTCAWLGIGCGLVVILAGAIIVGAGYWMFKQAKNFEQTLKDPEVRKEKAQEVLAAPSLPEGYYAVFSVDVFGFVKMALLSVDPPGNDGNAPELGSGGFMYFEMYKSMSQDLKDYVEGRSDDQGALRRSKVNIDMNTKVLLDRGVIEMDGLNLIYLTQVGRMMSDEHGGTDGLQTLMLVDCPEDNRTRVAILFDKLPANIDENDPDYSGTVVDPQRIQAFMSHFALCE